MCHTQGQKLVCHNVLCDLRMIFNVSGVFILTELIRTSLFITGLEIL